MRRALPRVHPASPRRRLLLALWAPILALAACGGGGAGAAGGAFGLIVVPDDPSQAALPPEELEARGLRPYFHDFGQVPLGESVQHVFRLRNTDPAPVVVTRMQASCGCTRPLLRLVDAASARAPRGPGEVLTVPAGADAELVFRIDTSHTEPGSHNVDKLYTVQMATDSAHRGYLRFEAHIVVERAFQASPQPLDLGRVPRNGGGRGKVDVVPVGATGARVVGVGELPPGLSAELVGEPLGDRTLWTVEIELEPPLEAGPLLRRFDLMTEDADGFPYHPFPIEVRAFATRDVDWNPQRFVVRNAAGAAAPLETSVDLYPLLAGERLAVTGARLLGEGTEVLDLALSPHGRDAEGRSERWTLVLRTRPPFGDAIVRGKVVVSIEGHEDVEIDVLVHPH